MDDDLLAALRLRTPGRDARTMIVSGDRDRFFPVSGAVATYQAIPRASLWVVPNGDHIPVLGRRAREFLDLSLAFLRAGTLQP